MVVVFPNGLQGKIWSTILRSQNLSVIWESPDVPLSHTLKILNQRGSLPDLLVIDTRLHHLQPFHLCRWCQQSCPGIKILLINGAQSRILAAERQWAMTQGAVDLLPRINQDTLISSAAANLRKTLDLMDILHYDQKTFITALLKMGLYVQPRSSSVHKHIKLYMDSRQSTSSKG